MRDALPPKAEIDAMMQFIFSDYCKDNPLAFVMYAFPWGEPGTPLEHVKGPRAWQRKELERIAAHIKENKKRAKRGEEPQVYKLACASGRGIGKSTMVSWLTLWMISCHIGSTTIITANTDAQLTDKTFAEVNRWLSLLINKFWFDSVEKSIKPAPWFKKIIEEQIKVGTKYYYANGVLWSEDNPEAFAGAHSQHGMLLIMDESSGVPEKIWTVSRGFFTEPTVYRFWFTFSNPRAGAGAFYDCFHTENSSWNTLQINSLEVEGVAKSELLEILQKFGEDSDEARVEVFGQFPRQGERQFISRAIVEEAAKRELINYNYKEEALIMGVDVARFGDDKSVLAFRAGRDARTIPAQIYSGLDNMQLVSKIEQAIYTHNPDHICIDGGAGAGVIDRLKQLGYKVQEVLFGSSPTEPQYFDYRTELYARLRDWLPGGAIANDNDLKSGLANPEKELIGRESREKLESKEKMKKRGIKSPDQADALALTFHIKGAKKAHHTSRKSKTRRYREEAKSIFD